MHFSEISRADIGKPIDVVARVEQVHQTAGPTIFVLSDGISKFTAKAFVRPGVRAHSNMNVGDIVSVSMRIQEYNNNLEGSIDAIQKADPDLFAQALEQNKKRQLHVESIPFLVQSEHLEKLRNSFEQAAMLIKKAIFERRPIMLRHNADCDGYSGGVALERAILPLVRDQRDSYQDWKFFRRLPSRAPFYSLSDVLVDLVGITNDMLRSNTQPPLIIVVDNGSGKEDAVALKSLKVYGCPIIIVDHHFISTDIISPIVDVHINPYLVGYNSQISAGMLATELARIVNNTASPLTTLPALSGTGDKVESGEMQQYLKIAESDGYTADELKKIALCIDFAAYYLRSMEGRVLVDDLLGKDRVKQKQLVELWYAEARRRMDELLVVVKQYIQIEETEKSVIASIPLNDIMFAGEFPSFGKITGMTSDWLKAQHQKHVFVLGVAKDMVVIRASRHAQFNLNDIVTVLRQKPYLGVSGGGHERAGTLHFAPAAQDEVLAVVHESILRVQ
ncbi:MAG TPA: hypothetical protein VJH88_00465 [Candidatus Nanoarchaeia archaeon]|nr:hypothetical protein [Candidatus Nanoarchaeia archaeon]